MPFNLHWTTHIRNWSSAYSFHEHNHSEYLYFKCSYLKQFSFDFLGTFTLNFDSITYFTQNSFNIARGNRLLNSHILNIYVWPCILVLMATLTLPTISYLISPTQWYWWVQIFAPINWRIRTSTASCISIRNYRWFAMKLKILHEIPLHTMWKKLASSLLSLGWLCESHVAGCKDIPLLYCFLHESFTGH